MSSSSHRWHIAWHTSRIRALAALATAAGVSGVAPAWADCASPKPAIVWTYPAEGDTGVPTNADLWVLLSGWDAPPRVSLKGAELAALELPFGYELGELAPNTEYTLDIQGAGEEAQFELTFSTGNGPVAADPNASPGAVVATIDGESSLPALSPMCQAARDTQDCFDQGQDTYYVFEPSGSARGWLIAADSGYRAVNVWPGECGAPRLFGSGSNAPCVTLYGIDASGTPHEGQEVCARPVLLGPDTPATSPRQTATGAPGVVLPPANATSDEAGGQGASSSSPAPAARTSSGCALGRSADDGASLWVPAMLGAVGMLGRWRTRRSRRRAGTA